jgi:energy-coupling factor transport system permease protein
LHPGAWLAWFASSCFCALLTSNPLYLALGALVTGATYVATCQTKKGQALLPFVLMGLAFAALSVPFNVLTGSAGETVMFSVPQFQAPGWLGGVTFGGRITAEALLIALGTALTIATLVLAAAGFNAAVDHFRLLQLAPKSLAPVVLPLSVAAVVVVQSAAQARVINEAQRLRGRRARGLRVVPGLVLPVLRHALDRSVQRAESLDARGFAGGSGGAKSESILGLGGVGLSAWGAFAFFYYGAEWLPVVALIAGSALVAAVLLRGGGRDRTRFHRDSWGALDTLVAVPAMVSAVLVFAMRVGEFGGATYLPYPYADLPAFHAAGATAFLFLFAPALVLLLNPSSLGAPRD